MPLFRLFARVVLGVVLILHGLGHAVLPLSGATAGADRPLGAILTIMSTLAILGFVSAGLGLLHAPGFQRIVNGAATVAATTSVAALTFIASGPRWPGIALDLFLVAVILTTERTAARHPASRWRRLGSTVAIGFFLWVGAATLLRPWYRTWGVTPAEQALALPGDPAQRTPSLEMTHAVTIDAPPEAVWPWLVQLGQDRAGFYSYDWLERLFLADIRNVEEIRPEWQHRAVGDFVRATQENYLGGLLGPDLGWFVTEVHPNHALVLHQWGAFVLLPYGNGQTRFIVRSTISDENIPVWGAAVTLTAFELPHFIMERRMLLGIKERAERRG